MNLILVFFLVITFLTDVSLLYFSVTRKDKSRSVYFVMLTLATTVYTLGNILFEMSETNDAAMNALRVANLGIALLAPCFLLISLSLFQPKYLKSWMLPAIVIYGMVMFFSVMFNDSLHFYYTSVDLNAAQIIEHGFLFWIQQVVGLICMIPAYIILISRFIIGNKKLRKQMIYILIGAIVVFVANIINIAGIVPAEIDIVPFAMTITLIFFIINVAKYKLLDITSIATDTAFESMEDAVIILDNEWCFLFCNNNAKILFPALESFLGTEPISIVRGWPEELEAADKQNEIVFEREGKTAYSQNSTYRANVNKIIDGHGTQVGWYIIIRNITSMTFLINQLENLATTDPLTGVANRRHFMERVQQELDMSASFRLNLSNGLIMYDLDFFKKVNDTYGHAAGDHILCSVVEIIKKQLRSYDIICRYGGEEFVIFTPTSSNEEALFKLASRLCRAVENAEIIYKDVRIPITASFGAVQMPPDSDLNEAMLAVDEAMYKAKNNGRNQVVLGRLKKEEEIKEEIG